MRGVIEFTLDDLRQIDQSLREARKTYRSAGEPNGPGDGFWEWMKNQPNGALVYRMRVRNERLDLRQVPVVGVPRKNAR